MFQEPAIGYTSLYDSSISRLFIVEGEKSDWIGFAWKVTVLDLRSTNFPPVRVSRYMVNISITVGSKSVRERVMV